jgi:hypothetical protein
MSMGGSVETAELRHEYAFGHVRRPPPPSFAITKQGERHFVSQHHLRRTRLPPFQPHARVASRHINTFSAISLYLLKHRIADIRQDSSAFLIPLASVKGFKPFPLLNWIIAVYIYREVYTPNGRRSAS